MVEYVESQKPKRYSIVFLIFLLENGNIKISEIVQEFESLFDADFRIPAFFRLQVWIREDPESRTEHWS